MSKEEELFKKNFPEYVTEKGMCLSPFWDIFCAGLEAGETKWHNLRENPDDLPKVARQFWSQEVFFSTNKGSSMTGYYDYVEKAWYEKVTDDVVPDVIAWCEKPKFEE